MCRHFQILIITTQEDNLTSTSKIDVLLRNCTGQNCLCHGLFVGHQLLVGQFSCQQGNYAIIHFDPISKTSASSSTTEFLRGMRSIPAHHSLLQNSVSLLLPLLPCFCCHATPQSILLPFFFSVLLLQHFVIQREVSAAAHTWTNFLPSLALPIGYI